MNDFVERCTFHWVRCLERTFPPPAVRGLLMPWAVAKAASRFFEFPVPVPDCLNGADAVRLTRWQYSAGFYLNHMLHHFPERLAAAEWQRRCRILGLDHWQTARQHKRPVILAYCHFGPSFLLREWLRAAGLPVAVYVRTNFVDRSKAKWMKNRVALLPDVPSAIFRDQLRDIGEFLAGGNVLLIAVDHDGGRQIDLPAGNDWTFSMATGAIRLAARHNADLIPCSIIDEGDWRYVIELGRPVDRNRLSENSDWSAAGMDLLQKLLAQFRRRPTQFTRKLAERFRPALPEGDS